jgi:hypothetical protein
MTVADKNRNAAVQVKDPLRTALAQSVKELIWRCGLRLSACKRPICLYASRRSGSTLLMEMIGVNPGVMFSDQPFGIYTASSANINLLPVFAYGQIAYPDEEEQAILTQYLEGLFSGRVKANAPWKFWSPEFHFRNDRVCLKITDAKPLIEWIDRQFDVHTVMLTRHPIAQAISVANVGWLPTGKGLLRNRGYVERWLSDDLEAFCWEAYRSGSELVRRTLDWAIENLPLIALLPKHPDWLYVSYEDLVANTRAVVDTLADRLELPARNRMIARANRPSRSTRRESTAERQQMIQDHDREKLLNSWQTKIAPDELRDCFEVLDRFAINLYRPDCSMPQHYRLGRQAYGPSATLAAEQQP